MDRRFEGRAAIVTGAGRGIGRAVTERLAREGARVAALDRDAELGARVEQELQAAGLDVTFLQADIADTGQVEATIERITGELGPPAVVVNNAALVRTTDFFAAPPEEIDDILAVNVRGGLIVGRTAARAMINAGNGGAIVNMSSITAAQGSPGMAAYSASKGAVSALTRSMAVALAEHGIRVNAVAPGTITTEAVAEIYSRETELRRQVLSRTPLRRLGEPAEVASVVAFLASDDASYITGQVIYPDGGRLALSYTVAVDD
ncbi:SDR family NAD(P)-dependent oxidoreductase [Saccharomonospora sp. NPDC046836]|uniref:SDR family NAD(P)-dependent oxidoreductase n=1 Tax=Saccharomonospora sp. NPDC046836 TaxID=3156921 RepID=UPI0033F4FF0C